MKLIDNWKEVLLKSMANWAAYIGVTSGVLDITHPALRVIDQGLSTLAKSAKDPE